MARPKAVEVDDKELTELAREIIAEAETPEVEPTAEPTREWSYPEVARFQLTGEYPDWYTQSKT
jgi:hypothetical protein